MPLHDWTRVEAGLFHDFHQGWLAELKRRLNRGMLPRGYYALQEQVLSRADAGRVIPDIITLDRRNRGPEGDSALALAPPPARAAQVMGASLEAYRRRQSVLAFRHVSGNRLVALVECVSPGNKGSAVAYRDLLEKSGALVAAGVHLAVIDMLPPTPRDPHGFHAAFWEEIEGTEYRPPHGKPLTAVSYEAGEDGVTAYIDPLAVGDALPELPLFLAPGHYVPMPLEVSYQAVWDDLPEHIRDELAAPPA